MSLSTVTLDSEYLKKVRSPEGINFFAEKRCKKYTSPCISMKIRRMLLGYGLLAGAAIATFCHYGLMEAGSEAFREFVKFIIAVNFDGLLGGIHNHVAFFAPM